MRGDSECAIGWPKTANCGSVVSFISSPLRLESIWLAQPCGRLQREIGQDRVRARALDAGQRFQHAGAFVEPAVERRSAQHRIFAADLVSERRRTEAALDA